MGRHGRQTPLVRASASATVTTLAQADALGFAIAQQLRDGGAVGNACHRGLNHPGGAIPRKSS